MSNPIVRAWKMPGAVEVRDAAPDGALATLDIQFARFNVWNEINSYTEGRFLERLAPGAFTKTMQERGERVVSLFNHGYDPTIGDKVLGGIVDMGERAEGPYVTVELDDTTYNRDLLPGLKRGAYGASYMFEPLKDDWDDTPERSDHNPNGLKERTIHEVRLYEAGPVTFPADPGASVAARSMTDRFLPLRDPQAATALAERDEPATPGAEPLEHSDPNHMTAARAAMLAHEWAA